MRDMAEKFKQRRFYVKAAVLLFLLIYFSVIIYHEKKPLPAGLSYEGKWHQVSDEDISFLYDLTYPKDGKTVKDQHLFKEVFRMIEEAEDFIVLDFFLYNDYYDEDQSFPPLSEKLTRKLIEKKEKSPDVDIRLITDEINTSYGSHRNWQFDALKDAGIEVMITDVSKLRDSNPLYSAGWRMFIQWFGTEGKGRIPNMMANEAPNMTVRSYLKLLNVKANHRKTVTTEKGVVVLSANPHDASANHSNIGFSVQGPIAGDVLDSERPAARLAGGRELPRYDGSPSSEGALKARVVTEGKVLKETLNELNGAGKGDEVWLAMFYLAERKTIEAILEADKRGAKVRMILDPNENAFGSKKAGLPNRPVARELAEKTDNRIKIRWYNTGEEQYHPKLLYIKRADGGMSAIGGSTNFTSRNMDNFNLETDLYVKGPADSMFAADLDHYFKRQWNNEGGEFTVDFSEYQSALTPLQQIVYFLQKVFYFTTY